jgi:hypothetical protein
LSNINKKPNFLTAQSAMDNAIHHEGALQRKSSRWPYGWKKKYVVVNGTELKIYGSIKDLLGAPVHTKSLENAVCSYGPKGTNY